MQRITTLLDKIKELNTHPSPSVIEIDLMMDYVKVMYADLLEWRNKVTFTDSVSLKPEPSLNEFAIAMEENHQPLEATPEVSAPSIELDNTSMNYESPKDTTIISDLSFPDTHPSGADIRSLIGINDKYQYISELFGNNKEAYDEVIAEINSFETEEDALSWLHITIFTEYGWNDEMESVQSFYRLLSEYFSMR